MTLDGAINLNETNDYIIYTMNSVTTGQYGVVVPKNITGTLNMLVDLHMKSSFDGVGSGTKTKEQLVSEISEEYNKLKTKYVDGMLVMPMIDDAMFSSIVNNDDKQKMFDEVKKIGAITSELYKKLTEQGIEKQKIDQKIIIVEKKEEDEKFVTWLKEQMPNFVDGIRYAELNVQEVVNPFTNDSIFGPVNEPVQEVAPKVEEPVVNTQPSVGGIFDNVAPVAPEVPVTPVEPVVSATPVEQVTIPVAPTVEPNPAVQATPVVPEESVTPVTTTEPVVSATPVEQVTPSVAPVVDVFSAPAAESTPAVQATLVTPVENTVTQAPVASEQTPVVPEQPAVVNQAPVVEGPKPVDAAMLEGTIAFTPIPNHPNNPVEPVVESDVLVKKKSKGFVNLAILLVVLVGVTLISIELGKYLYSVYGA